MSTHTLSRSADVRRKTADRRCHAHLDEAHDVALSLLQMKAETLTHIADARAGRDTTSADAVFSRGRRSSLSLLPAGPPRQRLDWPDERTRRLAEPANADVLVLAARLAHIDAERRQALDRVELLSKAVEHTTDGVCISDSAGRIEYVNPSFHGMTGYAPGDALGNTPRQPAPGGHEAAFDGHIWGRVVAGKPYRGTLVSRKKTGEASWANQTIAPITNAEGAITHVMALLRDETEVRKYHERDVQLRLARAVQQRFYAVPPQLTGLDIAAASHPADETGGDYFDFVEGPPGVLYVAIGDVSGHGFDAALIMALTRAYMRSYMKLGMEVGAVLGCANRAIVGDLEGNRYVTMLLVRLDLRDGTLTYASAGHISGVVLHGSDGTDSILDSTGMPLGLFADAAFGSRRCSFRWPQILVLGTDGATETSDRHGIEFGNAGVLEYVRAHAHDTAAEIAAGVYDAARSFGASDRQHDDITSVIIKVTSPTLGDGQAALPFAAAA